MRYVLVHGAFRAGWSWDFVRPLLHTAGHETAAPDLTGMGANQPGSMAGLEDWVADVVTACADGPGDVVLVGHSMGGIAARVAASRLGAPVERLVLLDAPLIADGQRAIDVSSPDPVDESHLPPADTMLPPSPVGPANGFDDPALAAWVNERLCPTPFRPSLHRAMVGPFRVEPELIFCAHTPTFFPSSLTRARCDADGTPYTLLDAHHDAPLLAPAAVAALLLR